MECERVKEMMVTLMPPMARMLGLTTEECKWNLERALPSPVPLRRLLELLEQEVSVEFNKILTREPFSYYEQIRIFIDGVLISNQDYEQEVGANSRVLILPPYVDG